MANIAQGIGDDLHAVVIVIDGEVPLPHRGELLVQEDGAGLLVRQEEALDGDLELAHRLFAINGKVLDIRASGPKEPTVDAGIVYDLLRISRIGRPGQTSPLET
jgi:hypothetical protein